MFSVVVEDVGVVSQIQIPRCLILVFRRRKPQGHVLVIDPSEFAGFAWDSTSKRLVGAG